MPSAHRAARVPRRRREGLERHRRRAVGLDGPRVRFCTARPSISSVTSTFLSGRLAVVATPAGDGDALLLGEGRALQRHRGDAEIGRVRIGHRHRRHRRAVGKSHLLGPGPAATLEVGDQDHLPPRQRRFAEDAVRQLQRGTKVGRAGTPVYPPRAPPPAGSGPTSTATRLRRPVEKSTTEARSLRRRACRSRRARRPRPAPSDPRSPCWRSGRAAPPPRGAPPAAAAAAAARRKKGRANASDDQRQRRKAQQQQRPVPDPAAAHRLVGDALQEHQRRKLDDVLPLALDQVNDHRDGESGEPEQEERRQERHGYRTLVRRSRVDR